MSRGRLLLAAVAAAAVLWFIVGSKGSDVRPASPGPVRAQHGALAGRVTDTRLGPVAGAVIEALFIGVDDAPRSIGEVRSDASGAYALEAPPPPGEQGLLLLRVRAEGFAASGRQVDAAGGRYDFALVRERTTVTVVVRDEAERTVPNAEIVVSITPRAGQSGALAVFTQATDAGGGATFADISAEAATIQWSAVARGRGRAHGTIDKPAGDAPVRIDARLDGGVRLVGTAVDAQGKGVAGLRVHVAETSGPWSDEAASGGDGSFAVAGVPRAHLAIDVRGDWVLAGTQEVQLVKIERGEREKAVRVVVEPAGSIAGRAVDPGGRSVAGATVSATPSDRVMTGTKAAATDRDGRFVIRGLRVGTTWDLEAKHPDRAAAFADGIGARTTGVDLVMHPGGSIAGRVVDDAGRGYGDIEVYAQRTQRVGDRVTGLKELASVRTEVDGTYRIARLSPGTYRVEVRARDRMAWSPTAAEVLEASVADGQTAQLGDARLARGGAIRGRVTVAGGKAPAALLPEGRGGAPHRAEVRCSSGGTFTLEHLEAGAYAVTVHHPDFGYASARAVVVRSGGVTDTSVTLEPRLEVVGTVVDADGKPVPNALVDAYSASAGGQATYRIPGRAPDNFTGNVIRADGSGKFTLRGMPEGRYRVRVAKDGAPAAVVDVAIPSGHVVVALPRPATLEVHLAKVDRAGSRTVLLETPAGAGFSGSAITDAQGVARFTGLPPGAYRVRAIVAGVKESSVVLAGGDSKQAVLNGASGT
jgi:protocatechuate 3,4-dioxygenase beta subunit